jgi:hypothetical protein
MSGMAMSVIDMSIDPISTPSVTFDNAIHLYRSGRSDATALFSTLVRVRARMRRVPEESGIVFRLANDGGAPNSRLQNFAVEPVLHRIFDG